jgi:hypothetical protein
MEECLNCKELDKRVSKWLDHIGCSPIKYQRYDRLLTFVQMASQLKDDSVTIKWIRDYANDLLKEIKE